MRSAAADWARVAEHAARHTRASRTVRRRRCPRARCLPRCSPTQPPLGASGVAARPPARLARGAARDHTLCDGELRLATGAPLAPAWRTETTAAHRARL